MNYETSNINFMNHFFRSIVFFISFVAFWNCYAEIDP